MTLGRVLVLPCEKTAKKHERQTQSHKCRTEGGQEGQPDEQRLQRHSDVLSNRGAVVRGMHGEIHHHSLAPTKGKPSQQSSGESTGQKTERTFPRLLIRFLGFRFDWIRHRFILTPIEPLHRWAAEHSTKPAAQPLKSRRPTGHAPDNRPPCSP